MAHKPSIVGTVVNKKSGQHQLPRPPLPPPPPPNNGPSIKIQSALGFWRVASAAEPRKITAELNYA